MKAALVYLALSLAVPVWGQSPTNGKDVSKGCSELSGLRDTNGSIVYLNHDELKARATTTVPPKIPPILRQSRIEGSVVIVVVVDNTSNVECSWVVVGHPLLAAPVTEAVRQWKFKPLQTTKGVIAYAGILTFGFKDYEGFTY